MVADDRPTIIYAVRRLAYGTDGLYDAFEEEEQTMENVIGLALEYASEDLNNSTLSYYLVAEWRDEEGNVIKTAEYDWNGIPLESADSV